MMSSEEENGEAKGKSSSTKRVRQRVDAGEPRNSYASIPNYTNTERRSLNGGFSRMLCDLGVIGALRKQHEMIVLDGGYNSSTDSSPPEAVSSNSTTNGLLRDILQQGRNGGHAPPSPDEEELMMNDDEEEELEDNNNDMQSQQQQPSPASGSESPPPTLQPSAATEAKRARVENIVSNMTRNGPTPVNGCKKRKLYQPQSTRSLSNGVVDEYDYDYEEEDHNSSPLMKRPNNGGNGLFTFKQQLRQMQQQLVAMQQQYMGMVDGGDSTDEDSSAPTHSNNNNNGKSQSQQDGPLEHSTFKTTEPPFSDCDNASLYDEPPRRHRDNKELLDYEWLAESLKAELSTSLSQVVDAVVARCARASKDIKDTVTPLSNLLDTKSPRTGGSGAGKVIDRGARANGHGPLHRTSPYPPPPPPPQQETPKPPVPPFFFHPLKPTGSVAATAAFLYGSPPRYPPSSPPQESPSAPEQTEAMSLVVASKKHKRHKVTDTRLQPPGGRPAPPSPPQPQLFAPPPPLVPVSLPTTVAIPNPSLHQSELFHFQRPPFDESPLHPSLLASFHHRGSPDTPLHLKQSMDDASDDSHVYDPGMPMISFLPGSMHTSTLTPMHLRKAKLMFFFARYPSSAVLKMYFPDIRFNKNNTAQLVKWFSNFREFFYIQMEKYARQAITEGVTNADDLKVNADSELLRVLNLHYNRNNHIDAPETFRYVVEQTLREFYKALIAGKDTEQSWKKSIYKIIARMDDNVPEYFKSPNFFEQLD